MGLYDDTSCGRCGTTTEPTQLYVQGWRCDPCSPWALAGKASPLSNRYCPPRICWCGQCPWATLATTYRDGATAVDFKNVTSGKKRASAATLATARQAVAEQQAKRPQPKPQAHQPKPQPAPDGQNPLFTL